jgi:methyl-accepting chemotaxis protein
MPTGSTAFLIFTGVITFAVLLQTIILIAALVGAKAAQKKALQQIDQLREDVRPFLETASKVTEAFQDITPRLRSTAANIEAATEKLRSQVGHIDSVVGDVTGKTRRQVDRIDNMVTDTLDAIAHGTRVVQDNVMAPLRQVGGWMSAIKAGMDLFRPSERRGRRSSSYRNDEDFV